MSETFAKVTENLTETPKYTEYTENSEIIIIFGHFRVIFGHFRAIFGHFRKFQKSVTFMTDV